MDLRVWVGEVNSSAECGYSSSNGTGRNCAGEQRVNKQQRSPVRWASADSVKQARASPALQTIGA